VGRRAAAAAEAAKARAAAAAPPDLRVREHPELGSFVDGLTKVEVSSTAEMLRLLVAGCAHRTTAPMLKNCRSSRSHALVTLEVRQGGALDPRGPVRLQMCDLAGSEDWVEALQVKSPSSPSSSYSSFSYTSFSFLSFLSCDP
jgi:hypothetical protein